MAYDAARKTPERRSAEFLYAVAGTDDQGRPMSALQLMAQRMKRSFSFELELERKVRRGLDLTAPRSAMTQPDYTRPELVKGSPLDQVMRTAGVLYAAPVARRGARLASDEHPSKYLSLVENPRYAGQAPIVASSRDLRRQVRLMTYMGVDLNVPFVTPSGEYTSAEPWPFPRGSNSTPAAAWSVWAAREFKKTQDTPDLRLSGNDRVLRVLDIVLAEVASQGVDFSQRDETGRTVTTVGRLKDFSLGDQEDAFKNLLAKHENAAHRQASLKRISATVSARRTKRFKDLANAAASKEIDRD